MAVAFAIAWAAVVVAAAAAAAAAVLVVVVAAAVAVVAPAMEISGRLLAQKRLRH